MPASRPRRDLRRRSCPRRRRRSARRGTPRAGRRAARSRTRCPPRRPAKPSGAGSRPSRWPSPRSRCDAARAAKARLVASGRPPRSRRGCRRRAACRAPRPPSSSDTPSPRSAAPVRVKPVMRAPARARPVRRRARATRRSRPRSAQADDAHEVRKDLQAVHEVAPGPDEVDLADGAEHDEDAVDPAVGHGHARAEDVLEELLAVVGPPDERRVPEEERAEGDDPAALGDRRSRRPGPPPPCSSGPSARPRSPGW